MSVENGEWIMHGVEESDPCCLHTVGELEAYVNEVGFLPLFSGNIPDFSVEERTLPDYWWSGDEMNDPWEWRKIIAGRGNIAYGKFFEKRAGFISREWLPRFVNYRRDGYDFDARWDEELAGNRQKKIMDLFDDETELYSNEAKHRADFGKNGEKNFDGILTELEMQMYLTDCDFRQRQNKRGENYGWAITILSTPEHIFGRELVTSAYSESPEESFEHIAAKMRDRYPDLPDAKIRKALAGTGR
ncbi:MAG: hypothetical protein PHX95_00530 [Lachnospiraceae bacterium]|nr:hypothetical protein [Lachnospiraceae bacterium]